MALGYVGKDKHGRAVSVEYCDICAASEFQPMLHQTLYKIAGTPMVLCELHAIYHRRRPPYPGWEALWNTNLALAEKGKLVRTQLASLSVGHAEQCDGVHPTAE